MRKKLEPGPTYGIVTLVMGVRLWHDDVRPAPEGWLWAPTNGAAIELLKRGDVVECSLDHDLGCHEGAENGQELVEWMVQNEMVPEKVTIHSWNPDGARYMAARLNRFGHNVTISPFKT